MYIRKARACDKEGILHISDQVWEGQDYIPSVIDVWLSKGGLWVAEIKDQIVGFANISELSPGEFWWEGLRVHSDYRGMGVAKALAKKQIEYCLSKSPRSIRFATLRSNKASIKIGEDLGFASMASFTYMAGDVNSPNYSPNPTITKLQDPQKAVNKVFQSKTYVSNKKLLPHGWVFKQISPPLICKIARDGNLFSNMGEGRPSGSLILLASTHRPDKLSLAFISGESKNRHLLAEFAIYYAKENEYDEVRAMVAKEDDVKLLEEYGLTYDPDFHKVLVYDYPLDPPQ